MALRLSVRAGRSAISVLESTSIGVRNVACLSMFQSPVCNQWTRQSNASWLGDRSFAWMMAAGTATLAALPVAMADIGPVPVSSQEQTSLSHALGVTAIGEGGRNTSTVIESDSGAEFPTCLLANETLLGKGCRWMRKLVRVYAVAVYVNQNSIQAKLKPWQEFSTADMEQATAVWDTLCSGDVGLVIRLQVVRQVGGGHMADGFERALKPRALAFAAKNGGRPPKEVKKIVRQFCNGFRDVGTMKEGSTAHIRVDGSKVEVVVDGRLLREMDDPSIAWAVADMYLGAETVIPSLRSDVAQGIVELLNE